MLLRQTSIWTAEPQAGETHLQPPPWMEAHGLAWSGSCHGFTFTMPLPAGSYMISANIDASYVVRPQCVLGTAEVSHTLLKLQKTAGSHYQCAFVVTKPIHHLCFAADDLPDPLEAAERPIWSDLKIERRSRLSFYASAARLFWHFLSTDRRRTLVFINQAIAFVRTGKAPTGIAKPPPTDDEIYQKWIEPQQATRPSCRSANEFFDKAPSVDGFVTALDANQNGHSWLLPDVAGFCVNPELKARLQDLSNNTKIVTFDDDLASPQGKRHSPYFRPEWSPTLARAWNYIGPCYAIRSDKLDHLLSKETLASADPDTLLQQAVNLIDPAEIQHMPHVYGHWNVNREARDPRLSKPWPKPPILSTATTRPSVDILIPTRNRVDLLRACIESIEAKTDYPNYRVTLIDNGSDDPEALDFMSKGKAVNRFSVHRDEGDFNFSRLNNQAAQTCSGDYILLLNNDTTIINPDWLSQLMVFAEQDGVGAVGAKLYFPNGKIQHAGLVMAMCSSVAGHVHKEAQQQDEGYFGSLVVPHEVSALTAACLLVRRAHYEAVGGMNEQDLTVAFNDVDLSLKLREHGLRLIWTPWAELLHHESITRGRVENGAKAERALREVDYMRRRWTRQLRDDPYYSPRLSRDHFKPSLAP